MNRGLSNWNLPELSIRGAGQEDRSSGNENGLSRTGRSSLSGSGEAGSISGLPISSSGLFFSFDMGWN